MFNVVSIKRIIKITLKVYFHQGLIHLGWIDQDRWGLGGAG